MKTVLCVNNDLIKLEGITWIGQGLKFKKEYTTTGQIILHPSNGGKRVQPCYYIEELKELKLVRRFIDVQELKEKYSEKFEDIVIKELEKEILV